MSRLWTLWPCASMFKLCCRNNNMGRSFEKKFWLFGQFSEHNCYSSLMTISYSWTRIYIFLLSKHWPLKVAKQCSKRKLVSILNFESVAKKSVKVFSIPSLLFLLIISYNVLKKNHFFVLLKVTCLVTLFDRKLQVFKNSPKLNTVVQMARLSFQQIKIRLSLVHLEKNVVGKWKSQNADSLKETLAFSNFPSLNPPPFGCLLCTQSDFVHLRQNPTQKVLHFTKEEKSESVWGSNFDQGLWISVWLWKERVFDRQAINRSNLWMGSWKSIFGAVWSRIPAENPALVGW